MLSSSQFLGFNIGLVSKCQPRLQEVLMLLYLLLIYVQLLVQFIHLCG
jgi:hypothetical protein